MTVEFTNMWGAERIWQANLRRQFELDRLIWGEGGLWFKTREGNMAHEMEDVLGKTQLR